MSQVTTVSYKQEIKNSLKSLRKSGASITLSRIASRIGIQYTYLSKVLNSDHLHLSEDQVYLIGEMLELSPWEAERLLLIRSHNVCEIQDRKNLLYAQLVRHEATRSINAEIRNSPSDYYLHETAYLFDASSVIVHVALDIDAFRRDPRSLARRLGIQWTSMKVILSRLQALGFIDVAADFETVAKVRKQNIHYTPDHPLMRMHHLSMRQSSLGYLMKLPDEEKKSFMVTFTASVQGIRKIRERFDEFVAQVQKIVASEPDEGVFQLQSDLFRWL